MPGGRQAVCLLVLAQGPQPAGVVEGCFGAARVFGVGLAPMLDTALSVGSARVSAASGAAISPPSGEGRQGRTGAGRQQVGAGEPSDRDTG